MALTPSTMLPLATVAPGFQLPDTDGKTVSLADFKDKAALVVVFMCNHCPYVIHIRAGLAQLARDYQPRGVAIVGINANDAKNYPADSPAKMQDEVKSAGYTFPYLVDAGQHVARAFGATCTFHAFVLDRDRRLRYQGRVDSSRIAANVTDHDLRNALDDVLDGREVRVPTTRAFGCSLDFV